MKITHALFAAIALTASLGAQAQTCGPGTSDPQCTTSNANRLATISQEKQRRVNEEAKRDGTFGQIGEKPTTSSTSVNNSTQSAKGMPR